MLWKLIQRQLPLGASVTFRLKTGEQVTGILTEIEETHVSLMVGEVTRTILIDVVEGWERMFAPQGATLLPGYIMSFNTKTGQGQIASRSDATTYRFHGNNVVNKTLIKRLTNWKKTQIPVEFLPGTDGNGPIALMVSDRAFDADEMISIAIRSAEANNLPVAIRVVKQLLKVVPSHEQARELLEMFKTKAQLDALPKNAGPYYDAKRAYQMEKDREKAIQLYKHAIALGDNKDSAVKDLASLFAELGRFDEAIDLLQKHRKEAPDISVSNLLASILRTAGKPSEAIDVLTEQLVSIGDGAPRARLLQQLGTLYYVTESWSNARSCFEKALVLNPTSRPVKRQLALCLAKESSLPEAERVLQEIAEFGADPQTTELAEAVFNARQSGLPVEVDTATVETILSDTAGESSTLARFFLDRCQYHGVPADRVANGSLDKSDVTKLEDLATQLGTRRPRDRAELYLSAAKIAASLADDEGGLLCARYLCRSFASRGDAAIREDRSLDTAQTFYAESLSVNDAVLQGEQDALNALTRFLFSTLGQSRVPLDPNIPPLDDTLEVVLTARAAQQQHVFRAMAPVMFRSRYAFNKIVRSLYSRTSLRRVAVDYLLGQGVTVRQNPKTQEFVQAWNQLRRRYVDAQREVALDLRFLLDVTFTTASLEHALRITEGLPESLHFNLDKDRLVQIGQILQTATQVCKEVTFEEKERLCTQIEKRCESLLLNISGNPTLHSVESFYPAIQAFQQKAGAFLSQLYELSKPIVAVRLPLESYVPDDARIEVQIVVQNGSGCSPAEAVELVVASSEGVYGIGAADLHFNGSLRGGDQCTIRVPLTLTEQALSARTFSFPVSVRFRTRSGDTLETAEFRFPIRLYSPEDFAEIDNPYTVHASGQVVEDKTMFYGRDELINRIARALSDPKLQHKTFAIYGQKRAGKSSILYHLKQRLSSDRNILIVDLGNIGKILDPNAGVPFQHQFLWAIVSGLMKAVRRKMRQGAHELSLSFPDDKEFFGHPTPVMRFNQLFDEFHEITHDYDDWASVRVVLFIDEFTYVYDQILVGRVPDTFMKNWKALLQDNHFSAVLVGQDVMPKFKQAFPNEFGMVDDERVTYLQEEYARQLIDEPIRIGGIQGESRYREKAIDLIMSLTAGSPFYIQILCDRLVDYMNRKRAMYVTDSDVEQVMQDLVSGVNALGREKFDNLIDSGDTSTDAIPKDDLESVLRAVALGSSLEFCPRDQIRCVTSRPIDVVLDDLVKRDVIEMRSNKFRIRVGLFKEWLKAH